MNVRSSKALICEDLTDKNLANQWENIPIDEVKRFVNRIQTRIAKAVSNGKFRLAKRLQYLLVHSFYAKILAVKSVTETKGKRTPGIDGEVWTCSSLKMKAVLALTDKEYRAKPLKRVYIPKPNSDKMRPLSIPTMKDRAMQALYALALQPWSETTADRTSFGFRIGRSTQDACEYAFTCLSRKDRAQWILEGDIKGCFDNISHEWLKTHIPIDKSILSQFLKAGFIHNDTFYNTEMGTPQGGVISPILANMTLDGMDALLKQKYRDRKVNLIRYADDFIITADSKELAEDIQEIIRTFLHERGLELSETKTRITHINDGFNFLGWNFRKYQGTLLVTPSKESVERVVRKISQKIKSAKAWSQDSLIEVLNPIILGWSNYHRHNVSSKVFKKLDSLVWQMLWTWAKRRHGGRGKWKIADKYWQFSNTHRWVFRTKDTTLRLFADTKIVRHPYLKMDKNPYLDLEYFEHRKNKSRLAY